MDASRKWKGITVLAALAFVMVALLIVADAQDPKRQAKRDVERCKEVARLVLELQEPGLSANDTARFN